MKQLLAILIALTSCAPAFALTDNEALNAISGTQRLTNNEALNVIANVGPRKISVGNLTASPTPAAQSLLFFSSNGTSFYGNSTATNTWLGISSNATINGFAADPTSVGAFSLTTWVGALSANATQAQAGTSNATLLTPERGWQLATSALQGGGTTPLTDIRIGTTTRGNATAYSGAAATANFTVAGNVYGNATGSKEHVLINNWSGQNTLAIQNKSASGYSAVRFLNILGDERTAIGVGGNNTTAAGGSIFENIAYWEGSNYVLASGGTDNTQAPPTMRIVQTGVQTGNGNFGFHRVFEIDGPTGDINIYNGSFGGDSLQAKWDRANSRLGLGAGNNAGGGARKPVARLDVDSTAIIGPIGTAAAREGYVAFPLTIITPEQQDGQAIKIVSHNAAIANIRITHDGSGSIWSQTGRRLEITDRDGLVPLKVMLDNTGVVAPRRLQITNPSVPASASATGTAGEIAWDANYIYVAVGTNTWKRAALSTW